MKNPFNSSAYEIGLLKGRQQAFKEFLDKCRIKKVEVDKYE